MTAPETPVTPNQAVPGQTPAHPAPPAHTTAQLLRAILTDIHFWVPAIVLALGILLLIALH